MKLEQQVVSLELAKQLKALNVPQDSLFYWSPTKLTKNKDGGVDFGYELKISIKEYLNGRGVPTNTKVKAQLAYSAFTVSELGEMLPWRVLKDDCFYILFLSNVPNAKGCWYENRNPDTGEIEVLEGTMLATEHTKTEADCRAKMLMWLIENKYLEVKQ